MRATLALVDVRSCKLRYVKDNSSSLLQQLGGHSPMRVLFLKWLLVAPVPDAQGKGLHNSWPSTFDRAHGVGVCICSHGRPAQESISLCIVRPSGAAVLDAKSLNAASLKHAERICLPRK
jgi:hypothetical protein